MWHIIGDVMMGLVAVVLLYAFFFQDLAHWLYEKIIVNQWDERFRAEYRLFHPKATFAQEAHHKLDYQKIYDMEKEIFGKAWHDKSGEYHPYPFLYHPMPISERDLDYGFYSRYDDRKHYCTDVPDTLKSCEECDKVRETDRMYRESEKAAREAGYKSRAKKARQYWEDYRVR